MMMYIKINPNDTETHWNTAYCEICMSEDLQSPLRGSKDQGPSNYGNGQCGCRAHNSVVGPINGSGALWH